MLAWSVFLAWLIYGMFPAGSILLLFLYATLVSAHRVESWSDSVQLFVHHAAGGPCLCSFFLVIFILMSGMLTPVSAMPEWAQLITYVNPLRYFIEVLRALYLKGSGFADLQMQIFRHAGVCRRIVDMGYMQLQEECVAFSAWHAVPGFIFQPPFRPAAIVFAASFC